MKKTILALLLLILIPSTALSWNDCPIGQVLCNGECGLFIDTDNDGICDSSQSHPDDRNDNTTAQPTEEEIEEVHDLIGGQELRTKTVNEVAEIYQIDVNQYTDKLSEYLGVNVKQDDSFETLHDNYGLQPSVAKDISTSIKLGIQTETPEANNKQLLSVLSGKNTYHLIPISLILVFLYLIGHILSKKGIIRVVNHRKIWNVLLLVTFLISGILGILLILKVNFGIIIPLPFNILFWHVEIGIAMFAISIFHILWHWAYFKNMFKIKNR